MAGLAGFRLTWRGDEVLNKVRRVEVKAVNKTALAVERQAKINAPVDTGRMRASIHAAPPGYNWPQDHSDQVIERSGGGIFGIAQVIGNRVVAEVGSGVSYAIYTEAPGNVRGVGRRPWLWPALEQEGPKLSDFLKQFAREEGLR